VNARETTSVQRGALPEPPKRLDESKFRQYLEGVTLNRAPRPQTVAAVPQSVLEGAAVPASERASVPPSTTGTAEGKSPDTTDTGESAEAQAAPQTLEVHTTQLQPTSPQSTGSTAGTAQTGQQVTSVQTTTTQTGREQPRE